MVSLIAAAARSRATGDALGALKWIAVRDDPPALASRGIAMAQLGEYPRARELLRRAARRFGAHGNRTGRTQPRPAPCCRRSPPQAGVGVSGLESDGGNLFFCGGGHSGKIRVVRRPKA